MLLIQSNKINFTPKYEKGIINASMQTFSTE